MEPEWPIREWPVHEWPDEEMPFDSEYPESTELEDWDSVESISA